MKSILDDCVAQGSQLYNQNTRPLSNYFLGTGCPPGQRDASLDVRMMLASASSTASAGSAAENRSSAADTPEPAEGERSRAIMSESEVRNR